MYEPEIGRDGDACSLCENSKQESETRLCERGTLIVQLNIVRQQTHNVVSTSLQRRDVAAT